MKPEDRQLLIDTVKKLDQFKASYDAFVDIYYRTNMIDKMVLLNPLVLRNTDIVVEGTKGLKIGKNATDKISVYGATPVVQAAAIASPAGGGVIDAQARTAIDLIRTALQNFGITA